jgi:hypothetical protein
MEQEKLNNMSRKLIYNIFLFIFLCSCNTSFIKNDLPKILDVDKVEIKKSQILNEWAGIHGDGFILEIYKLSEKTIQNFEEKSLKKLPDKKEKDKIWQKYNWSTLPIDSSYNEIFIMCLNYFSNNAKIRNILTEIKELIEEEKRMYYSFYYRPNKENPQNVQLFILDIENKKLYVIDQQI